MQTQPSHWQIWGQDWLCAEGKLSPSNGTGVIKQEVGLKSKGGSVIRAESEEGKELLFLALPTRCSVM